MRRTDRSVDCSDIILGKDNNERNGLDIYVLADLHDQCNKSVRIFVLGKIRVVSGYDFYAHTRHLVQTWCVSFEGSPNEVQVSESTWTDRSKTYGTWWILDSSNTNRYMRSKIELTRVDGHTGSSACAQENDDDRIGRGRWRAPAVSGELEVNDEIQKNSVKTMMAVASSVSSWNCEWRSSGLMPPQRLSGISRFRQGGGMVAAAARQQHNKM